MATDLSDDNATSLRVGANIRYLRKKKGKTLAWVAARIGSDTGNLSRVERGLQGFSEELIGKIANALGCHPADFFTIEVAEITRPTPPSSEDDAFLAALRTLRPARQAAIRAQVFDEADQIASGPDPTLKKEYQRSA